MKRATQYDAIDKLLASHTIKQKLLSPILLERTNLYAAGGRRYHIIDKEISALYHLVVFRGVWDGLVVQYLTPKWIRLYISLGLRFKVVNRPKTVYRTKRYLKTLKEKGRLLEIDLYKKLAS